MALHQKLVAIRDGDVASVSLPGFDHAVGDPKEDEHTFVRAEHQVVIVEGLYLLHPDDGWGPVGPMFHLSIFVAADIDACVARLKIRNKCIPGYTAEETEIRA